VREKERERERTKLSVGMNEHQALISLTQPYHSRLVKHKRLGQ